ncbi:SagB/ThcOx family dehydrogenase [Leifsonia soli]|uniref:SagB-type dehydrogenase family enzyme n=1 Tax=Leifsonia soli TaxID=582665 RepID=A0A852T2X6_9MICO|nr:SagB/ThcOx family dehydrogenase [Leifsonia soli]NYD75225.1 SagB-type dehydrogenase family enzyme [Leifsonia soli]
MNDTFRPLPRPRLDDPAENFLVASKMSGLVSASYSEAYGYEFATDTEALGRFGIPSTIEGRGQRTVSTCKHVSSPMPLVDALRLRSSASAFAPEQSIPQGSLFRILDESVGISSEFGRGTPSPGKLYPLDFFVIVLNVDGLEPGFYGYDTFRRELVAMAISAPPREWLHGVLAYQRLAETAAFHVFVAASFDRVRVKYGQRSYRFALLEAGHSIQSMILLAVAENLASCSVGGYFDQMVDDELGLNGIDQTVIHGASFGRPQVTRVSD